MGREGMAEFAGWKKELTAGSRIIVKWFPPKLKQLILLSPTNLPHPLGPKSVLSSTSHCMELGIRPSHAGVLSPLFTIPSVAQMATVRGILDTISSGQATLANSSEYFVNSLTVAAKCIWSSELSSPISAQKRWNADGRASSPKGHGESIRRSVSTDSPAARSCRVASYARTPPALQPPRMYGPLDCLFRISAR